MDTGAHDVARDDTQISHFLGLVTCVYLDLGISQTGETERKTMRFHDRC